MIHWVLVTVGAIFCLIATPAIAHEVRPAYLEIRETGPEQYSILWKTPARGDARIRLAVELPESCRETIPVITMNDGAATVARWSVECEGGLPGQEVSIAGLERTLVETIARFERLGGATQSVRLMGGNTSFVVAEPSSILEVAAVYGILGIEHILLGFDHLCFVLALLLLIDNVRKLIWTITAFTVAHSITLAAATLGYISAPSGPIEALIALSIALVAAEAVAKHRGQPSPTAERPWLIAFGFGLLHGLGFAGALSETGLPDDAIPVALLFFNVGVEIGQLAFVAVLLVIAALFRRIAPQQVPQGATAVAFAIGTLAAFWTIERVSGIIA